MFIKAFSTIFLALFYIFILQSHIILTEDRTDNDEANREVTYLVFSGGYRS